MTDAAPIAPSDLRRALSRFATGVTVITARDRDGAPIGFTASSFNALSLDPPMILWSLSRRSIHLADYRAAEGYAVNVLARSQHATADRFARPVEDRFAGLDWAPGANGAPVIAGALAVFECAHEAVQGAGDHQLFIGRVTRFEERAGAPLTFFAGAFGTVTAQAQAPGADGFHEDYLLYLLARASSLASEEFHARLAAEGVPAPVWRVLAVLSSGPATVGRLAEAVLYKQPTLTKLLQRMEADGLVERRRETTDGREVTVRLTPEGAARAAELIPLARDHEAALLRATPAEEAEALRGVLRAFIARAEAPGPDSQPGPRRSRRRDAGRRRRA